MIKLATKNFAAEVQDIDEKGAVTIYMNAFDNKDSDGDISAKGSFTKTFSEQFARIKHFLNHDPRLLIGIPIEMKEDNFGARVISQLNLEKEIGRDTYSDYKLYKDKGRTLEHSFGFEIMARDKYNKAIIKEYKVWEYSTLTSWGANELTPLVDMKGLKTETDIILKIQELTEMYNLKYSDGRLKSIENALKSLVDMEPPEGTSNAQAEAELMKWYEKQSLQNYLKN